MSEPKNIRSERSVAARWTPNLAQKGWTPVSDVFLDNYHRLTPPLKYSEAMFVIHLIRHKWDAKAPYPSFKVLAKRMGISPEAARLHARSLQDKGYLFREMQVGQTNKFHLNNLFIALEKLICKDTIAQVERSLNHDLEQIRAISSQRNAVSLEKGMGK